MAIVTCGEVPDLHPDDRLLLPPLAAAGVRVEPVAWDAGGVDWAAYDLAVLRSPWDYAARRDEFVAWATTVPALANPAPVVEWNTDKRYLTDLAGAGVPVVPTTWLAPGDPAGWPGASTDGVVAVKPAVGAGSADAGRYDLADPGDRRLAAAHVARLHADGRLVMVQPYLPAVDTYGETALLFFAGPDGALAYSHAVRKGPMLTGPYEGPVDLYKAEKISPRTPTAEERAVAEQALAAVPARLGRLLYARVDLIPGPAGTPLLIELELTEPSLFLDMSTDAADSLTAAILARLRRPGRGPEIPVP